MKTHFRDSCATLHVLLLARLQKLQQEQDTVCLLIIK